MPVTMEPIGFVKSPVSEVGRGDWEGVVSEIHLDPAWTPGLLGLEENERVTVVFYLDRARFEPGRDMVRHPRDREDLPMRGVFATRSQYRPNPVAVTDARLLWVRDNVIGVEGLDALDGTPVLDIKPAMRDI